MTVFAFVQDDTDNPLARLSAADVQALPFGATELDCNGLIMNHIDTEPGGEAVDHIWAGGADFFTQAAPWASGSVIEREFRAGTSGGTMNVVFDCAVRDLAYKVRVHLKTSPIMGTYWVFIKKLNRR